MKSGGLYIRIIVALAVGFIIAALMFRGTAEPSPEATGPVAVPAQAPSVVAPEPVVVAIAPATVDVPRVVAQQPVAKTVRARIPEQSVRYRLALEQAVQSEFGLDGPVDIVAAQIHQESAWNPDAQSPYAVGLAQFTPATSKWLPDVCPHLGQFDPWDSSQAIRAAACYNQWLFRRNAGATLCDRYAFMLSDYNGGAKWRMREQQLARDAGTDPARWFGSVDVQRARKESAHKENRQYVIRILTILAPAYADAGWPQQVACD